MAQAVSTLSPSAPRLLLPAATAATLPTPETAPRTRSQELCAKIDHAVDKLDILLAKSSNAMYLKSLELGARGEIAASLFSGAMHGAATLLNKGLRQSSVNLGAGVVFAAMLHSVRPGTGYFLPPIDKNKRDGKSWTEAFYFDRELCLGSPLGKIGYARRGKWTKKVNFGVFSASYDEKSSNLFVGIPNIWMVNLGEDIERGTSISYGNSYPFIGSSDLGVLAGVGAKVYSPLLDPVGKYFVRPVAKCVAYVLDGSTGLLKRAGSWATKGLKKFAPVRLGQKAFSSVLKPIQPWIEKLFGDKRPSSANSQQGSAA